MLIKLWDCVILCLLCLWYVSSINICGQFWEQKCEQKVYFAKKNKNEMKVHEDSF